MGLWGLALRIQVQPCLALLPFFQVGEEAAGSPHSLLICSSVGKLGPACGGSLGLTSGPVLCGSTATARPASLGL